MTMMGMNQQPDRVSAEPDGTRHEEQREGEAEGADASRTLEHRPGGADEVMVVEGLEGSARRQAEGEMRRHECKASRSGTRRECEVQAFHTLHVPAQMNRFHLSDFLSSALLYEVARVSGDSGFTIGLERFRLFPQLFQLPSQTDQPKYEGGEPEQ
jgi:hypothetical protein